MQKACNPKHPGSKNGGRNIKKSQNEITLDTGNLGKKSGVMDLSINNRIQEIEGRISDAEDIIESIDTIFKENKKCKKLLTQNLQKNPGQNEKNKPKDYRNRRE